MKKAIPLNPRDLRVGDLVEIVWVDVQGLDRQTPVHIKELPELKPTRSYGVVVRLMESCVVIAHELGDEDTDGFLLEQLPYRIIERVNLFGRVKVDL